MKYLFYITLCLLLSCSKTQPVKEFAIAIHGGAGVIPKTIDPLIAKRYKHSLEHALALGVDVLKKGGTSLEAVEKSIRFLENDSLFNAGIGAVFTNKKTHELDASIMDGKTLECGAVAGVKTVKNPISLARLVKDSTNHVLLIGDGAEEFATEMDVERVPNTYFSTQKRYRSLLKKLAKEKEAFSKKGTVGVVALDKHGNLAAGTSTGGLTNKKFGRVGDSPIIGAGTYAKNATCAISSTGTGEEFIRYSVARQISDLMEYKGYTLEKAMNHVVFNVLQKGDGGTIGVDKYGNISMQFNSNGMFRAAADSEGHYEVKIWE